MLSMEEEQQIYQIAETIMSRGDNRGLSWNEVVDKLEKNALDKQQKSVIITNINKRNNE